MWKEFTNSIPDRARGWESATTVHEGKALNVTGCCVHGAKPNRICPSVISSRLNASARQQPGDDDQHHERDQNQRHVGARHADYPGGPSARRRRRISSSLLPENMGPTITSIQPMFPFTMSTDPDLLLAASGRVAHRAATQPNIVCATASLIFTLARAAPASPCRSDRAEISSAHPHWRKRGRRRPASSH